MNSYEFEVAAKNAVIEEMRKRDTIIGINDLQMVWFCHIVGNKKALIYGEDMQPMYAEVTYVKDQEMMYVDMYEKSSHNGIPLSQCDIAAHV